MTRSQLIVIEGLDGSGKATQSALLADRLCAEGKTARRIAFPDYESRSSSLVKMYLGGEIGTLDAVNIYAASSFYACDRYISFETGWKNDCIAGHTIVVDRYTTSNMVHQGSKLPPNEWDSYIRWLEDYEYGKLGLPQPSVVIYLDMHPDTSHTLIDKRYGGDDTKRDLHESNARYLANCRKTALYCAEKLGWQVIRCDGATGALPVQQVAELVYATVSKFTSQRKD